MDGFPDPFFVVRSEVDADHGLIALEKTEDDESAQRHDPHHDAHRRYRVVAENLGLVVRKTDRHACEQLIEKSGHPDLKYFEEDAAVETGFFHGDLEITSFRQEKVDV